MLENPISIYIYTLTDPRDNLVRYVGVTKNPKRREREHLKELKQNTHKTAWIKSLKKLGFKPYLEILDETTTESWAEDEVFYINQLKSWGFELTNTATGGIGNVVWTKEMKDKLSKSKTGIKLSEERRKQMSEYNTYVYSNNLRALPKTSKPIYSYNNDGSKNSSYPSTNAAAKLVGGNRKNIERSTKTKNRVMGLRWSFIDLEKMPEYIKPKFVFTENRKRALAEYNAKSKLNHA